MSGKIIHIGSYNKFMTPFISFVEDNFDMNQHEFNLTYDSIDVFIVSRNNLNLYKRARLNRLIYYCRNIIKMHQARKVIFHGLFDIKLVFILFFMPWLLKKCYWIILGGDLYGPHLSEKNFKWKINEVIRRPVLKNIGHLITYIPGDVELARQWYGAKGDFNECLMYLSNVIDPDVIQRTKAEMNDHKGKNILVGNSADPSNNHIEVLEKLLPHKHDEIRIFVPLSYGDRKYAKNVIKTGKAWFGEKFVPLTSFVAFDEYIEFLKSIDIAIFNHKRQQAMGNTIVLLGMGKTVYLRTDVSQWHFFKAKGIKCLDIESFNNSSILRKDAQNNSKICLDYFNENKLRHQYSEVFK